MREQKAVEILILRSKIDKLLSAYKCETIKELETLLDTRLEIVEDREIGTLYHDRGIIKALEEGCLLMGEPVKME